VVEDRGGPGKGLWVELNPRTGRDYLRGEVETVIQGILAERLRPGMVFYDLGANIGLFSLIAARLVGPTGKVISFEPDPEAAARLRRNIVRNGYQNTTVVQAGVWSETGRRLFAVADASSPDRGVGRFAAAEAEGQDSLIDCITLDDFLKNVAAPDAITCDMESAEVEVLRGAKKILQGYRPWIVCELHSDANRVAVGDILNQFGYRVESVDASHVLGLPDTPPELRR
jgi:FkbM family methyltransferase